MIELNRHIEILLLSSDCVIVPDLGGFMTHHVDARYDAEDHMFVPPLRTLGFNPQLTMNDSLLAQSYIEAYDISYPEAIRRIESEVSELKQQLYNDGYYEMSGIGELSLNEDGHIVFEPCEAGLLTPALYGLGAFEMMPLHEEATSKTTTLPFVQQDRTAELAIAQEETSGSGEDTSNKGKDGAIVIKMSWIRNAVAVAAAVLMFFLITPPVANSNLQDSQQLTVSQMELLPLPQKSEPQKPKQLVVAPQADTKQEAATDSTAKSVTTPAPVAADTQTAKQEEEEETGFCLVLASQVAKKGAEDLVERMRKQGYADTRVFTHKNVRRVVYGHFKTKGGAYAALQKLHDTTQDFDEAWVYEMN